MKNLLDSHNKKKVKMWFALSAEASFQLLCLMSHQFKAQASSDLMDRG